MSEVVEAVHLMSRVREGVSELYAFTLFYSHPHSHITIHIKKIMINSISNLQEKWYQIFRNSIKYLLRVVEDVLEKGGNQVRYSVPDELSGEEWWRG